MKKRTFNEMVEYFIDRVAKMKIEEKYKLELVGMVSAIQTEHKMQKQGKWNGANFHTVECSECGFDIDIMKIDANTLTHLYHCPNCGALMEKSE